MPLTQAFSLKALAFFFFFFSKFYWKEVGTRLDAFLAGHRYSWQSSLIPCLSLLRSLLRTFWHCLISLKRERRLPPRLLMLPSQRQPPSKGCSQFVALGCAYVNWWGRWINGKVCGRGVQKKAETLQLCCATKAPCKCTEQGPSMGLFYIYLRRSLWALWC